MRFRTMFNFKNKVPQHIQDINIPMLTSQWEEEGMREEVEEHRGAQAWGTEQATDEESERV